MVMELRMPELDISVADFAVVRTPLLPFQRFVELAGETSDAGVTESREQIAGRLHQAFCDPVLSESLYVASRSLHERFSERLAAGSAETDRKLDRALMKYFGRMTSRCTPFGLLAGVSWAPISVVSDSRNSGFHLSGLAAYRRHCRVDMGVIARIGTSLLKDRTVRRKLGYFLNPTLYKRGARWCYVEARQSGEEYRFEMSAIESTPFLDQLIHAVDSADGGTAAFDVIARCLATLVPGEENEQYESFVDQLIDNGLLLSTATPPLTAGDPFPHILSSLDDPDIAGERQRLELIDARLSVLNSAPLSSGAEPLSRLEAEIKLLLGGDAPRDLVQTDLYKPAIAANVPESVIASARSAVNALLAFSPAGPAQLKVFRRTFRERYGDAEVPLLEALDPDLGVAFARQPDLAPLLDDLATNEGGNVEGEGGFGEDETGAAILVRALEDANRLGLKEVTLADRQIAELLQWKKREVPPAFSLFVSVLDGGTPGGEGEARVLIRGVTCTSGVHMFGRFCAADPALASETRKFLAREEALRQNCIHAEIVHWPVERIGNVILRSSLRAIELPLFGRSLLSREKQVHVADLLVSVIGSEIVLRCRRTGRRVLPQLSNAHNTTRNSIVLYSFLSLLQMQEPMLAEFRWPAKLQLAARLPRVRFGDCILASETWNLDANALLPFRDPGLKDAQAAVRHLAETWGWPRFVELAVGDNCLCVDLRNPLSIETLAAELRDKDRATIREVHVPPGDGFVRSDDGSFSHELILPFIASRPRKVLEPFGTRGMHPENRFELHRRTSYMPGDRWLSAKIYSGTATNERLIADYLSPLVEQLRATGLVGKWFFIRYGDPDPHLRIRFEGEPAGIWGVVVARLHEVLKKAETHGLIWRVVFDTYEPEEERYGGRTAIAIAESIFHLDSECAFELVSSRLLGNANARWKHIALATDLFWRECGFDEASRAQIYPDLAQRHAREKFSKVVLDRRYRECRAELHALLFGPDDPQNQCRRVLGNRTRELLPLLNSLRERVSAADATPRYLMSIYSSLAHMRMNRLFLSAGLAQERAVYELLARLLTSRVARRAAESA